jgi:DNA-binding CsgD family transcriptional regulator
MPAGSLSTKIFDTFKQDWSAIAAWTENCEAHLIRRRKQSVAILGQQTPLLPQSYVLFERSSGAVRFRVEADSDGSLPVDKIAGLLAVHCLVRGQAPQDYEVMVIMRDSLLHAVAERVQQILAAGRALGTGVKVSRREQEVLGGILQSLTNKEIAAKLNVSERTVKFHVSSLLAKFGVTDRVALSREVALGRMRSYGLAEQVPHHTLFGYPVRDREGEGRKIHAPDPSPPVAEVPRARGRVFPMIPKERFAL